MPIRALLVLAALVLGGMGCLVAGIYILVGVGYALIVTGILLYGVAALLRAGMKMDGV